MKKMQEMPIWSLGWEDPLGKEMATYPSILTWKIPWREEPGRLQSMGSQSQTWLNMYTLLLGKTGMKYCTIVTWRRHSGSCFSEHLCATWNPVFQPLGLGPGVIREGTSLLWGFPHHLVGKPSACNAGDPGSFPGLGRSPGEGNGNPLQYSCLENPMDRGAWQATVHGIARVGHNLATKPPKPPSLLLSDAQWLTTNLNSCSRCWPQRSCFPVFRYPIALSLFILKFLPHSTFYYCLWASKSSLLRWKFLKKNDQACFTFEPPKHLLDSHHLLNEWVDRRLGGLCRPAEWQSLELYSSQVMHIFTIHIESAYSWVEDCELIPDNWLLFFSCSVVSDSLQPHGV